MEDTPILILLAGGKSSRMGTPKGLLDYHGKLWILEQVSRFKDLINPKVYIGLGYNYELYFESIPWFKKAIDRTHEYNGVEVRAVINHQPQFGAFSTLQTVLRNIEKKATVIVQPIDVPLFNKDSLRSFIDKKKPIVIPVCENQKGHPVKLKPEFWTTLLLVDLSSNKARLDIQIKEYNSSSITYHEVADTSVYQNINTLNKWNKYLESIHKK